MTCISYFTDEEAKTYKDLTAQHCKTRMLKSIFVTNKLYYPLGQQYAKWKEPLENSYNVHVFKIMSKQVSLAG